MTSIAQTLEVYMTLPLVLVTREICMWAGRISLVSLLNCTFRCKTCRLTYFTCPGHYGHIELPSPVYHPLFMVKTFNLLRATCLFCHRFKMSRMMVHHPALDDLFQWSQCIGPLKIGQDDGPNTSELPALRAGPDIRQTCRASSKHSHRRQET